MTMTYFTYPCTTKTLYGYPANLEGIPCAWMADFPLGCGSFTDTKPMICIYWSHPISDVVQEDTDSRSHAISVNYEANYVDKGVEIS